MNNRNVRERDILKLIKGLDITPTMYENATEKYLAIGTYLQEQGLECEIFPQGSFSLGTVVRPYRESKEVDYDLDFICCLNEDKELTTARYVKNIVKETLCNSEVYKERLEQIEWDKCWTIKYAEINGVGFNIDIVPAVPESEEIIQELKGINLCSDDADLAVAITNKRGESYHWFTSNPHAYKNWFERINRPFLEFERETRRKILLEKSRTVYNSIEEIPKGMERSALQRVIQILKHHRDVYYCRIKKESLKPTSAIITTICAEIAQNMNYSLGVFELLQAIVNDFEIYGENQVLTEEQFMRQYENKTIIQKRNGKWYIMNPVNPMDNLADSWNSEPQKAEVFFTWVKAIKRDYVESLQYEDNDFVALLENYFGSDYVKKSIDLKKYKNEAPQIITSTPKPWRN